MKTARLLSALALVILFAVPSMAQEKQARKSPAVKISSASQAMMRLQKLHTAIETIDLSAEQKEGLEKLHASNGPKMKEVLEKFGKILSDEQKAAVEATAKELKEAKKEGRQFFVAVEAAAKLTDEQKKEADKVGQEMVALQREIQKKVMGILTTEQQEKVKKAMMPKPKGEGDKRGKKKAE